jgi:hypothetical protein
MIAVQPFDQVLKRIEATRPWTIWKRLQSTAEREMDDGVKDPLVIRSFYEEIVSIFRPGDDASRLVKETVSWANLESQFSLEELDVTNVASPRSG